MLFADGQNSMLEYKVLKLDGTFELILHFVLVHMLIILHKRCIFYTMNIMYC